MNIIFHHSTELNVYNIKFASFKLLFNTKRSQTFINPFDQLTFMQIASEHCIL